MHRVTITCNEIDERNTVSTLDFAVQIRGLRRKGVSLCLSITRMDTTMSSRYLNPAGRTSSVARGGGRPGSRLPAAGVNEASAVSSACSEH